MICLVILSQSYVQNTFVCVLIEYLLLNRRVPSLCPPHAPLSYPGHLWVVCFVTLQPVGFSISMVTLRRPQARRHGRLV